MIVVLIIICLGLGFYGGVRYGAYHTAKENDTLRSQLTLQEHFSRTWAAEATDKYRLSEQIAQNQTATTGATINTVVHLLRSLESNAMNNTDTEQQEKISQLINQAKQLTS